MNESRVRRVGGIQLAKLVLPVVMAVVIVVLAITVARAGQAAATTISVAAGVTMVRRAATPPPPPPPPPPLAWAAFWNGPTLEVESPTGTATPARNPSAPGAPNEPRRPRARPRLRGVLAFMAASPPNISKNSRR